LTVKTYWYEIYAGAGVWNTGYADRVITDLIHFDARYF